MLLNNIPKMGIPPLVVVKRNDTSLREGHDERNTKVCLTQKQPCIAYEVVFLPKMGQGVGGKTR